MFELTILFDAAQSHRVLVLLSFIWMWMSERCATRVAEINGREFRPGSVLGRHFGRPAPVSRIVFLSSLV